MALYLPHKQGKMHTHALMQTVTVPVHPLSFAVLTTHYGYAPIHLANHDPMFDLLTGSRIRHTSSRSAIFTSAVDFVLSDHVARHVQQYAGSISDRLYRHHKNMLCWYVVAQVRLRGKGGAKPAVSDWLSLHGVDEDAYSIESAYKLYQRFGWELEKKNATFSEQIKRKSAGILLRKAASYAKTEEPLKPLRMAMRDIEVELVTARFLSNYALCFQRVPVCLPKHARIYLYYTVQGLTEREIAAKMKLKHAGVHHALVSMRNRIRLNHTVSRLIDDALALPEKK